MTESNRLGIIHPEAPERGLSVGKEWCRAINLAALVAWFHTGFVQVALSISLLLLPLLLAQCAKKAPPKEKCVGGKEKKHFTVLWFPRLCRHAHRLSDTG